MKHTRMQPIHRTFQAESAPIIPGIIDVYDDSGTRLGIPAQNIRHLRETNSEYGHKQVAGFVMHSSESKNNVMHDKYMFNISYSVLKQIYRAALAGQSFDLRPYRKNQHGNYLDKFEDLPEVKAALEQDVPKASKQTHSR